MATTKTGFRMMTDDIQDSEDGPPREQRDSLFLSCEITVTGARKPATVRVRNLSPGGMMVDGHQVFYEGARISTDIRGIGEIDGRVAWVTSERVGIAFDLPVDPKLARMPVGRQDNAPKSSW
jgi:hypothetical protein